MKKAVRLKLLVPLIISVLLVDSVPTTREIQEPEDDSNNTSIPADISQHEVKDAVMPTAPMFARKYLTCASFDEVECKKNGKCTVGKKTCHTEDHLHAVGCVAIFSFQVNVSTGSSDSVLPVPSKAIKKLDCIAIQRDSYMQCVHPDKCEQAPPQSPNDFTEGIGMCCCRTENCNAANSLKKWNWEVEPPGGYTSQIRDQNVDPYRVYWLIVIALLLMTLIACCLIAFIAFRKMQNKLKNQRIVRNCVIEEPLCVVEEEAPNTPLVKQEQLVEIEMVETPKELPITNFTMISKGRFGEVFRATWTDTNGESKLVAVKKLAMNEKKNFLDEKKIFDLLISLPKWYPSIVEFVAAEKIGDEFWIVTEFHERLSLNDLLIRNVISITSANRLILSMIDGLQFLHDDRPFFFGHSKDPIIHRDIKSKNILVKRDMTACIADFGLARTYHFDVKKGDLLGQVGTRRYMSPEVLEGATEFTPNAFKAMDVYSMALVMWEVIYRTKLDADDVVPEYKLPYSELGLHPSIGFIRNHVVIKKERPVFRPQTIVHDYMGQLVGVVEEMWDPAAYARITAGCAFAKVWEIIKSTLESSEGYHSGGSAKEGQDSQGNKKGVSELIEYHNARGVLPHPTACPFLDFCPPVPPIPNPNGDEPPIQQPDIPDRLEEDTESEEIGEKIFDVEMNRLLTAEEMEHRGEEEVNTRASTPTPSGPF